MNKKEFNEDFKYVAIQFDKTYNRMQIDSIIHFTKLKLNQLIRTNIALSENLTQEETISMLTIKILLEKQLEL